MIRDTDALRAGEWLVTPTRRLAHQLKTRWDAEQVREGRSIWRTPVILHWPELIERMFAADRSEGRLRARWLDGMAAALKWETLVRDDPSLDAVLATGGLGRSAWQSWQRLHEYLIPFPALEENSGREAAAFRRWVGEYRAWLERGNWMDAAQASALVSAASLDGSLRFVGFDRLTPGQEAFVERLRAAGVRVEVEAVPERESEATWVPCTDRSSEFESAARWAAARLDSDAQLRLAIVVPGLRRGRETVRRVLEQVLSPGRVTAAAPEPPVFDLSAARPLVRQAVVESALALLGAMARHEDPASGGVLLASMYTRGARTEAPARARLDAWARRNAGGRLRPARLAQIAGERDCPELGGIAAAGLELVRAWPARALPSEWSTHFDALLRAMGWPGEDLASTEYQAWQRWQELLGDFGSGNEVLGSISPRAALRVLRDVATQVLFEPEEQGAALVVIDPDTCAGMDFDEMWVCGMDASNWPGPVSPDPFLPLSWQVKRGMPGASASIELESAGRRFSRLLSSAPKVILSSPQFDEDAPLLPSPLLERIPRVDAPARWTEPLPVVAMFDERPSLERLADGSMPMLAGPAGRQGGARILELQAACPFRAAAEFRLGAQALEEPSPGIDAATRGKLLHEVLAAFWRQVGSRAGLAALAESGREALLRDAIRASLEPLLRHADAVQQRLLELEAVWLRERVEELLEIELERPDFEVEFIERERALELGGLSLRIRPDRVDRLADGGLAVLDYKTGADAEPGAWGGTRPELPQLPLYALSLGEEDLSAVAFGRLRSGDTCYAGAARDGTEFPGLERPGTRGPLKEFASWDSMLEAWRERLAALAEEYRAGDARLPYDRARACRYCELQAFCRVGEVARSELVDDTE